MRYMTTACVDRNCAVLEPSSLCLPVCLSTAEQRIKDDDQEDKGRFGEDVQPKSVIVRDWSIWSEDWGLVQKLT